MGSVVPTRRILAIAAGTLAGLAAASVLPKPGSEPTAHYIQADFTYDVSDPELVAGGADVVMVATVKDTVRVDGDRTVFRVRVLETLEGEAPRFTLVSQLGSDTEEGGLQELEGFPLMSEGNTYVMAVVAPSRHEPRDALLLLSAVGSGNKVQVAGLDDPEVEEYRAAVGRQRIPWPNEDGMREQRVEAYRQWQIANGLAS